MRLARACRALTRRHSSAAPCIPGSALGAGGGFRYGAAYWVVPRGDLQAALLQRLRASADGALHLGRRVEDFAVHAHGVTVETRTPAGTRDEHGMALIGADGLWSRIPGRIENEAPPQFSRRTPFPPPSSPDLLPPHFPPPS